MFRLRLHFYEKNPLQMTTINGNFNMSKNEFFLYLWKKYLLIIFKRRFTSLFYMDSYQDQTLIDSPENLPHKEHFPIEAHHLQNPSYHPHP